MTTNQSRRLARLEAESDDHKPVVWFLMPYADETEEEACMRQSGHPLEPRPGDPVFIVRKDGLHQRRPGY